MYNEFLFDRKFLNLSAFLNVKTGIARKKATNTFEIL